MGGVLGVKGDAAEAQTKSGLFSNSRNCASSFGTVEADKSNESVTVSVGEGVSAGICNSATANEIIRNITEIQETFTSLAAKLDSMEALVKNHQSNGGSDQKLKKVSTVHMATQTEHTDQFTFAEVAARKVPTFNGNTAEHDGLSADQSKKQEKQEKTKSNIDLNKNGSNNVKKATDDVKNTTVADDDNPIPKTSSSSSSTHIPEPDLPTVFFIHDSVMKNIDPKRLGHSYGCKVLSEKAYTVEHIEKAVASLVEKTTKPPEAIVIHCGLNDTKKKSHDIASKDMSRCITNIQSMFPNIKIMISKIAPTHEKKLEVTRNAFNAMISAEFYDKKGISFVRYVTISFSGSRGAGSESCDPFFCKVKRVAL